MGLENVPTLAAAPFVALPLATEPTALGAAMPVGSTDADDPVAPTAGLDPTDWARLLTGAMAIMKAIAKTIFEIIVFLPGSSKINISVLTGFPDTGIRRAG